MAGFFWFVWAKKMLSKPILPYGGWPKDLLFFYSAEGNIFFDKMAYFGEEEATGTQDSVSPMPAKRIAMVGWQRAVGSEMRTAAHGRVNIGPTSFSSLYGSF
jgi:hypothetical protein